MSQPRAAKKAAPSPSTPTEQVGTKPGGTPSKPGEKRGSEAIEMSSGWQTWGRGSVTGSVLWPLSPLPLLLLLLLLLSWPSGTAASTWKKAGSLNASQASQALSSGAARAAGQAHSSSAAPTRNPTMNPTEAKASPSRKKSGGSQAHGKKRNKTQGTKTEPEKTPQSSKAVKTEPEKTPQSSKAAKTEPEEKSPPASKDLQLPDSHAKQTSKEKPKEHTEQKSPHKQPSGSGSKTTVTGKEVIKATEQLTPEKLTEEPKKKAKKAVTPSAPVEAGSAKPAGKSEVDSALDDLIATLGEPEENVPESPEYTGPEVTDIFTSEYIEELGKREGSIPPKYKKLLESSEGSPAPPPQEEPMKPIGEDELIDSLSSDFTCHSSAAAGKKTEEEKPEGGEVLKAQSVGAVRSSAPPDEKKRKVEVGEMSDDLISALSDTLGGPEPEPETDPSSFKEIDEAKAKEEKLKKCGERDDTIPPEHKLQPATDKDGKPLLPKPEEKPQLVSEFELVDEFPKDFQSPDPKKTQSKPTDKTQKSKGPAPVPKAPAAVGETVSRTSMCSVQASAPRSTAPAGALPDDAVEALAGSLGKKEVDPEDKKPVVDKIKEKNKKEGREKLGEKEETIPPEYRLEEVKDKDGKPLLPKPSDKLPAMSDDDLLEALSEGFSSAPVTQAAPLPMAKKPAAKKASPATSEVVSSSSAPQSHAAALPPPTSQEDKGLDDALDQLSDSLGQRQPDPDEDKPMEDKVKEKAKAEHRDKLGERDDTIPPEYRHLLDNNDQGSPAKPPPPEEPKNPSDAQDPIDTLSGDFNSRAEPPEAPKKSAKDRSGKAAKPKSQESPQAAADQAKEPSSQKKSDGKKKS
ncbi:calpastatin isoform X5 [Tachyglossus aculeatus]|uniref:calpastatin isoform X5 n=1 Tax=Tachyglossus aculeatus TaxID=9261 RepID=UPI0018F34D98|nr:calpastatin isoform X5 [Tachyglossus aculeatus]